MIRTTVGRDGLPVNNQTCTGSHLSTTSTSYLEAVLSLHFALGGVRADPLAHAGHQVADSLWGREDVEWGGQSALVVEVA